jgi:hypothetical protein
LYRSTHPCGNNIDVKPIMQKNKRETHEGTCVGQSVGDCGGSGELVKRKRKTPEGTCVGQWIGRSKNKEEKPEEGNPLGQWIGSG